VPHVSVRGSREHTFVRRDASILHADLDAFYASVEQRDQPRLRGRPVIVGGGVVLAASYEARARGVRTAMGGSQARRLCPDAIVVPPRMAAYSEASKAVFAVFEDVAPVVEALSIDEAFLDVRGLEHISGTPREIAKDLRTRIRAELGLAITIGVARTKFLAKVASGVAKPDGLLVVAPEDELAFLHPLAVERVWGVGRVTAEKLHAIGVQTVGELARVDRDLLLETVGPAAARQLHSLAHNRDPRPVEVRRRRRSIGAQRALGRGRHPRSELEIVLRILIDRVTRRMRLAQRACRTVVLRMRFADYTRATRSHTLAEATTRTDRILAAAAELLAQALALIQARGITLLGVALTNLINCTPGQLALAFERAPALDTTIDTIRDRYGSGALTRGVLVGRDPGPWVPLLPD
jgi:DNA polymerase-4